MVNNGCHFRFGPRVVILLHLTLRPQRVPVTNKTSLRFTLNIVPTNTHIQLRNMEVEGYFIHFLLVVILPSLELLELDPCYCFLHTEIFCESTEEA